MIRARVLPAMEVSGPWLLPNDGGRGGQLSGRLPQLVSWAMTLWNSPAIFPMEKYGDLPSGKLTKNYWKWPFMVDLPIKNGDFP